MSQVYNSTQHHNLITAKLHIFSQLHNFTTAQCGPSIVLVYTALCLPATVNNKHGCSSKCLYQMIAYMSVINSTVCVLLWALATAESKGPCPATRGATLRHMPRFWSKQPLTPPRKFTLTHTMPRNQAGLRRPHTERPWLDCCLMSICRVSKRNNLKQGRHNTNDTKNNIEEWLTFDLSAGQKRGNGQKNKELTGVKSVLVSDHPMVSRGQHQHGTTQKCEANNKGHRIQRTDTPNFEDYMNLASTWMAISGVNKEKLGMLLWYAS